MRKLLLSISGELESQPTQQLTTMRSDRATIDSATSQHAISASTPRSHKSLKTSDDSYEATINEPVFEKKKDAKSKDSRLKSTKFSHRKRVKAWGVETKSKKRAKKKPR